MKRMVSRDTRVRDALLIALIVLACAPLPASSQETGELRGRVTYSVNGQAMGDVLVFLHEASLGVFTDAEGRYRIEGVPAGRHLVTTTVMGCTVSAQSVDVQVGRPLTLNLPLSPPVIDLEGLVVTALSADREAPFAVERLEAGVVAGKARTLGSFLQGKAAGVRVAQGSGQPGTDPSIRLRSATSVQIAQGPLIVLDGVITSGRLSDIDPMDVDHVEVLRGAAAAASYGSRGQGGVIEITTKRGLRREQPAARTGPLLIVDGVATAGSLSDLSFSDIVDIRKLDGPVAAILYGRSAEVGVIEATTRNGPRPGARTLQPICMTPTP